MLNIQNLGLQESIGVKYINGLWAKFGLKRLKATGIFVILLCHGGFKCDPETKFQTMNRFIKSVLKQSNTNVLQNSFS